MDNALQMFKAELAQLSSRSESKIRKLTNLAEEFQKEYKASELVGVIIQLIEKQVLGKRLPLMFLVDSMIRDLKSTLYPLLLIQKIESIFCKVFREADKETRQEMFYLRKTWTTVIPEVQLSALDKHVKEMDPNWPWPVPDIPLLKGSIDDKALPFTEILPEVKKPRLSAVRDVFAGKDPASKGELCDIFPSGMAHGRQRVPQSSWSQTSHQSSVQQGCSREGALTQEGSTAEPTADDSAMARENLRLLRRLANIKSSECSVSEFAVSLEEHPFMNRSVVSREAIIFLFGSESCLTELLEQEPKSATSAMEDLETALNFLYIYVWHQLDALHGSIPGYKRSRPGMLPRGQLREDPMRMYGDTLRSLGFRAVGSTSSFKILKEQATTLDMSRPMTKLCPECKLNLKNLYTDGDSSRDKTKIFAFQLDHLRVAKEERDFYNELVQDALKAPGSRISRSKKHYSFDFANKIQYLTRGQRKCRLFGVCNEGDQFQMNYLIDEDVHGNENSDLVISLLHHFFEHYGTGHNIDLHCDNCRAQNKNNVMLWYLAWRVMEKKHTAIRLHFMPPAHTKFAPDLYFKSIKKSLKEKDVSSVQEIEKVVRTSEDKNKNRALIVEKRIIQKWTIFLKKKFKLFPRMTEYYHFSFSSSSPGKVQCKRRLKDENKDFDLRKPAIQKGRPNKPQHPPPPPTQNPKGPTPSAHCPANKGKAKRTIRQTVVSDVGRPADGEMETHKATVKAGPTPRQPATIGNPEQPGISRLNRPVPYYLSPQNKSQLRYQPFVSSEMHPPSTEMWERGEPIKCELGGQQVLAQEPVNEWQTFDAMACQQTLYALCTNPPIPHGLQSMMRAEQMPQKLCLQPDFQRLPMATSGMPMSTPGMPMSTFGMPVSTPGMPMSTFGMPMSISGMPMSTGAGMPMSTAGMPMFSSTRPMSTSTRLMPGGQSQGYREEQIKRDRR